MLAPGEPSPRGHALLRAHLAQLARLGFDPDKHPRHPAGAGDVTGGPERDGGKFAPKDGAAAGAAATADDRMVRVGDRQFVYPPQTGEEIAVVQRIQKESIDSLLAQVDRAPGLTDAQRAEYRATLERVLKNMSTPAVARIADNAELHFYPSLEALQASHPRGADASGHVGGYWTFRRSETTNNRGELHLDGGEGLSVGIYAHELGHAVDGHHSFTSTNAWIRVWGAELGSGQLNAYSATSPQEGFAEVFRVVQEYGYRFVRDELPQTWKLLREWKLM